MLELQTPLFSIVTAVLLVVMTTLLFCCLRRKDKNDENKGKVAVRSPTRDKQNGKRTEQSSNGPTDEVGDFSAVQRETEILRSYRKPPPPKNRARQSRAQRAVTRSTEHPDIFAEINEDDELHFDSDTVESQDMVQVALLSVDGTVVTDEADVTIRDKSGKEEVVRETRSSMLVDIEQTLASMRRQSEEASQSEGDRSATVSDGSTHKEGFLSPTASFKIEQEPQSNAEDNLEHMARCSSPESTKAVERAKEDIEATEKDILKPTECESEETVQKLNGESAEVSLEINKVKESSTVNISMSSKEDVSKLVEETHEGPTTSNSSSQDNSSPVNPKKGPKVSPKPSPKVTKAALKLNSLDAADFNQEQITVRTSETYIAIKTETASSPTKSDETVKSLMENTEEPKESPSLSIQCTDAPQPTVPNKETHKENKDIQATCVQQTMSVASSRGSKLVNDSASDRSKEDISPQVQHAISTTSVVLSKPKQSVSQNEYVKPETDVQKVPEEQSTSHENSTAEVSSQQTSDGKGDTSTSEPVTKENVSEQKKNEDPMRPKSDPKPSVEHPLSAEESLPTAPIAKCVPSVEHPTMKGLTNALAADCLPEARLESEIKESQSQETSLGSPTESRPTSPSESNVRRESDDGTNKDKSRKIPVRAGSKPRTSLPKSPVPNQDKETK